MTETEDKTNTTDVSALASSDVTTIVVDCGSSICRAGFGGDDAPKVCFPSIVGRPFFQGALVGIGQKEAYVGDEALSKRSHLAIKHPVDHGVITDWDSVEKVTQCTILLPDCDFECVCSYGTTHSMIHFVQYQKKM